MQAWQHCQELLAQWPMPSAGTPSCRGRRLQGRSPLLRGVFPPLPGSPAVYRMQSDTENSTIDQPGTVGWMRA